MSAPQLVAVSAGLSQPSSTRLLADRLTEAARARLADGGRPVRTQVIELRELATAIADHMVTGFPGERLREALARVAEADGVIAVTPVFTASYSGLFKSFFDVMDNSALLGTPVLIAATGGTARHSLVLEHAMRPLFSYLRAVVPPTAVFAASEDWGGGDTAAEELTTRIGRAAEELAVLVRGGPVATRVAEEDVAPDGAAVGTVRGEPVTPLAEQLAALNPPETAPTDAGRS